LTTLKPNHLTLGRIALALLFGVCLANPGGVSLGVAVAVAAGAFVSDLLDGYLARATNQVSAFGICFDPIADKIFNLGAFAMLLKAPGVDLPVFPFLLMIIREVGISGVRVLVLSSRRTLIPAERFGKAKSALQFILIFTLTLGLWARQAGSAEILEWCLRPPFPAAAFWAVALVTFASSWVHLWRHRQALREAWDSRT